MITIRQAKEDIPMVFNFHATRREIRIGERDYFYIKKLGGYSTSQTVLSMLNWFLVSKNSEFPCDTNERPPILPRQKERKLSIRLSDECVELLRAMAPVTADGRKHTCNGLKWLIWQFKKHRGIKT